MSGFMRFGKATPPAPNHPPRPAAKIEQSPRQGRRQHAWGWLAIILGYHLALGEYAFITGWMQLPVTLTGLAMAIIGIRAVLRGRRHLAPLQPSFRNLPANERIVLFIRSFSEDDDLARTPRFFRFFAGALTPASLRTEEDHIAGAVAPFGRLVALGRPSDRLPPLGADRHYASDSAWQSELLAALHHANLVLLLAGVGRNLAWEVDQVVRRNDPRRLVLLVGPDRHQYARFRQSLGNLFPKGLPDRPAAGRKRHIRRTRHVSAVIWFDDDWTPHLRQLSGGFSLAHFGRRGTRHALRRALRPLYHRAGLPTHATSALPWPEEVKSSVILTAGYYIGLEIWATTIFLSAEGDLREKIRGIAFLLIFLPLTWVGMAAWAHRMRRGGNVVITLARAHGFITQSLMLVLALPIIVLSVLHFFIAGWRVGLMLLALGHALIGVGMVGMPATTFMLSRPVVQKWMDARL